MSDPLQDDPLLRDVPRFEGYPVLEPCALYSRLGKGGMGVVYRGRHLRLNIDVAVKCLDPLLGHEDEQLVHRFRQEANVAAAVSHQNLVRVYDVSDSSGLHYLVMEFIRGETLRRRVERKARLEWLEAAAITQQAADGMAAAHEAGIVHRDIKPDNIMVSVNGTVKVVDLGLAKALEGSLKRSTMTRGVMGTPRYIPPEQWKGSDHVGPFSDVWALGATLWFLLAGDDAIQADEMHGAMYQILNDGIPDIADHRDDVPVPLAAILTRATAADPADRYPSAGELARALSELLRLEGAAPEIADADAIQEANQGSLVSPAPPALTLGRIRSSIEAARTPPPDALTPTRSAPSVVENPTPPPAPTHRPGAVDRNAATLPGAEVPATDHLPRKISASALPERKGSGKLLVTLVLLLVAAGGLFLGRDALFGDSEAELLFAEGESALAGNDTSLAIERFEAARRLDPSLDEKPLQRALLGSAKNEQEAGAHHAAWKSITRAQELGPDPEVARLERELRRALTAMIDERYRVTPELQGLSRFDEISLKAVVEPLPGELEFTRFDLNVDGRVTKRPGDPQQEFHLKLDQGKHRIAVAAVVEESLTITRTLEFEIDSISPKVTLLEPAAGSQLGGLPFSLRVRIQDRSPIAAQLQIEGVNGKVTLEASSEDPQVHEATIEAPSGRLAVLVTDQAGNSTQENFSFEPARFRRRELNPEGRELWVLEKAPELPFVLVPGGRYPVGSTSGNSDEQQRELTLSEFFIARQEVSRALYRRFCNKQGVKMAEAPPWKGTDSHPVVNLSWNEARAFCRWLVSDDPSLIADLPTEAQWEVAARGRSGRNHPWGASAPDPLRMVFGRALDAGPEPVDALEADRSPFGVLGLGGNVAEWCRDAYGPAGTGGETPVLDPTGPERGRLKVIRGGSFTSPAAHLRGSARFRGSPTFRGPTLGFRPILRRRK